jgi:hypothetical protein
MKAAAIISKCVVFQWNGGWLTLSRSLPVPLVPQWLGFEKERLLRTCLDCDRLLEAFHLTMKKELQENT